MRRRKLIGGRKIGDRSSHTQYALVGPRGQMKAIYGIFEQL